MSKASDIRDDLTRLLDRPVAAMGLDLESVELTDAGRRRVLRVAVDKDGGVDMDDIAGVTREVSRVLDESDALGEQSYTLEVSSPGVDRPLTLPRHWRRNVGRLVRVTPVEGEPWTGRLTASDDDGAVLRVAGDEVRTPYAEVRKARVEIEFKPPREV